MVNAKRERVYCQFSRTRANIISMSQITNDQVEHIAKLARLALTEEEKTTMAKELGTILTYVEKLGEVDTTGVEPTAQVTGLENIFRPDEPGEPASPSQGGQLANPADLVAAAPQHERGYVKVKEVFTQ